MTEATLNAQDCARLTKLTEFIIPGTDTMPAAHEIEAFEALLQSAFTACGLSHMEVRAALGVMPSKLDWEAVRSFAAAHPAHFENLALLASGAYLMAPTVLDRLGFPAERRNPAGPLEAAEEYETGILEPVISRGPCFRDPRAPSADGR